MCWVRAICISPFARSGARDLLSVINLGIFYDEQSYLCGSCEAEFDANSNYDYVDCPVCGMPNKLK